MFINNKLILSFPLSASMLVSRFNNRFFPNSMLLLALPVQQLGLPLKILSFKATGQRKNHSASLNGFFNSLLLVSSPKWFLNICMKPQSDKFCYWIYFCPYFCEKKEVDISGFYNLFHSN